MRYKKRTGYEKGLVFRPLLIGQFTRRAFSWLPIIRVSLFLSLFHEIYIYISYIKQCTSNAMLPPSNGDKPKRCSAYEARDTNNTKRRERISSRESRDFPSRGFRLFRDTEREGGLFSIAWNSIGEGRGYKGLSGIWHGVSL